MRKLDPANLKLIGSLFILVFLIASIAVIVRLIPQQRGTQPRAASLTQIVRPTGLIGVAGLASVNCGANWQCVDEAVLDTSDHILYQVSGVGKSDLYSTSWTPPAGSTINSVRLKAVARKVGSDSGVTAGFLMSVNQGCYSSYIISTSWTTYTNYNFPDCRQSFPASDFPVKIAVGADSSAPANLQVQIAQIWVEVEYTLPPPPCSNECPASGAKQCTGGTAYQTCGNYDGDSCLEWSSAASCSSGQTCSGGSCISSPPKPKPPGPQPPKPGGTLTSLQLQVSVPYLVGETKIPVKIGSFTTEITVSPDKKDYQVDVKEANIPVGSSLTIVVGGNKTLLNKTQVTPNSETTAVNVGDKILGDITGDNKIDDKDAVSLLDSIAKQTLKGDLNADKATNSLDWAILLANYGKSGDF